MYIKTSEQHKVYITRSTVIQGKEKCPFSLSGLTSLNLVVKNYTWSGNKTELLPAMNYCKFSDKT